MCEFRLFKLWPYLPGKPPTQVEVPEYVVASVCPATPPLSDGVRQSRDAAPVGQGSLDDLADVPAAPFEGEKGYRVEGSIRTANRVPPECDEAA